MRELHPVTHEESPLAVPANLKLYKAPPPDEVPYAITVARAFTDREREELEHVLDIAENPYRDYAAFQRRIRELVESSALPQFLRDTFDELRARDVRQDPVIHLRNCPTGTLPLLDFEDPLTSKYERKQDFVSEAFLSVFAELHGTFVVTYRTANNGDMFHDVHPVKDLQFSKSQKSVNTLAFHTDLPDNKVRPDWVNLFYLRSSAVNEVYLSFVRNSDVLRALDPEVLSTLRKPLFRSPRTRVEKNISIYGDEAEGFLDWKPIIVTDRGYDYLCFNEDYTTVESREGKEAMETMIATLHRLRTSVFVAERDFLAICNNTCMHARHVVAIADMEAHRHRWVMKTWNVEDLGPFRTHFVPGRINTSDE